MSRIRPTTNNLIVDFLDFLNLDFLATTVPVSLGDVLFRDDLALLAIHFLVITLIPRTIVLFARSCALHINSMRGLTAVAGGCCSCRLPTSWLVGVQMEVLPTMFTQLLRSYPVISVACVFSFELFFRPTPHRFHVLTEVISCFRSISYELTSMISPLFRCGTVGKADRSIRILKSIVAVVSGRIVAVQRVEFSRVLAHTQ